MRSPGGHVLQSAAWARIREAHGWRAEFHAIGDPLPVALVLWRSLPLGRRVAYVPRGPVVPRGDRLALTAALEALGAAARERRAVFLKVDPELPVDEAADALRVAGYRRGADIQPVLATLEIDLAPDEDALFAALEKDTRWGVRQAAKRGVALREATDERDLRAFYDLYATTGARARFITRTWEYYRLVWRTLLDASHATLRLAERDGTPVAGAMTWHCGDRELYMYGATSDDGRRCHAAYSLLWTAIRDARERGFRRFDLGGVPADPSDASDTMRGPEHFKKGFGGRRVRYAGAHDAVPSELAYRAYVLAEPLYARALRLAGRVSQ
ncbi:peptidoglycan bridge formation glycyltransferase FemA/FemB family protein [soil metagenome]